MVDGVGLGRPGSIRDRVHLRPLCLGLSGGSGLVSGSTAPASTTPARPHAGDELNPFDDKVAIRLRCPKCGDTDWFEWKFLGKLTDPICGHSWYAGSGLYCLMQLRAVLAAGGKLSKHMSSGTSGGEGAWIAKAMGWILGLIFGISFRLAFGVLMIPIQAMVGLCQPKKEKAEIVNRSMVVGVFVLAAGVCAFLLATGSGGFRAPHTSISPAGSSPLIPTILDVPDDAPNNQKILGRWISAPGEDMVQPEFFANGRMREMSESAGGGPNGVAGRYEFTDESHVKVDGWDGPIALQITGREMTWVFSNGMSLSFRLLRRGKEHLARR